jgi:ribonuclease HII
VPATAVVKGDATVYCISAASVLAKVTRDRIMHEMHTKYPKYDFAQHKGYGAYTRSSIHLGPSDRIAHQCSSFFNRAFHRPPGVPAHMAAIYKHGPCAIHRRTFAPVKHMVNKK